jgi:hypothetical protein
MRRRVQVGACSSVLASILLLPGVGWAASTYTILHAFGKAGDGVQPNTSVVLDSKGRVYGNTTWGGYGYGTVFKLTRQQDGQWKEKKLYKFRRNDPQRILPESEPERS